MRLGVNGWRIMGKHTGVGRYLANIVRHWTPEMTKSKFKEINFYSPISSDQLSFPLPPNIRVRVLKPNWRMLIWENLRLAQVSNEDVVFHPSYSIPIVRRGNTVLVTHDAHHEVNPQLFSSNALFFYKILYRWSARNSTLVVTTTEAGKRDIARTMRVPISKIRVVYLAPAEIFREKPEPLEIAAVQQKVIGSNDPFFLFVGKLSGRRDIPLLLKGFAKFKKRNAVPHKLVMIGLNIHNLPISKMLDELNISNEVIYPGFVSDEVLRTLYYLANGLISASPYETISLPIMEAQAAGAAVICSDTAGMREITGGNALLLSIYKPQELADALARVALDIDYHDELVTKSLEFSKRFSWKKTSAETLDILAEVA